LKKVALIFLSLVFFLTACQIKDLNAITLEEVLSLFEEQRLSLKERKVSDTNIFGMKLNGIRPSSYELDGKKLLVFIFDSNKEREKGMEDFLNKTAAYGLVSYKVYEFKNVMIFYVYEKDLNSEIAGKLENIVSKLDED
jgi:hypothetical protein